MRPPPSLLGITAAAVVCAVLIGSCEALVHGDPGPRHQSGPELPGGPLATVLPVPDAPPNVVEAALDGLDSRVRRATAEAAEDGADISVVVLDRVTDQTVSNGNNTTTATASVAKLFIADDLLFGESKGQTQLAPDERTALEVMLQSSDDNAGERFWNRGGGDAIVMRVASRYGLRSTTPGGDGRWWNTISTTADLVRYYEMLLDGAGGLPLDRASTIVNALSRSTPQGIDGYPQRFGIPDGLYAEPVAVKQGWMCCIGSDWMHLSTGMIGPTRRYVMAIESLQSTSDSAARNTITQAVKTIFPGGHV